MGAEPTHQFSIVVPAYNAAATLAETLDAFLAQTYGDWEAIVVDDGSKDETLAVATRYAAQDSRIRVIHQENQGTAGAYNTAVSSATAAFVVMCSADDVLLPEHLARFSAFISMNPDYDIYSSNGFYWRPDGERVLIDYNSRSREPHSRSLADVIRVCFYSVGAVYRRKLFDKVGGYRRGVFGEDYDFWLRAMAQGARHRYLPEALSLFRLSPNQKSSNLERMYRSDMQLVSELRDTYPLSEEEKQAVDDSILERHRLTAELHGGPLHAIRAGLEPLAVALFGRTRARRYWHRVRAVARASARR